MAEFNPGLPDPLENLRDPSNPDVLVARDALPEMYNKEAAYHAVTNELDHLERGGRLDPANPEMRAIREALDPSTARPLGPDARPSREPDETAKFHDTLGRLKGVFDRDEESWRIFVGGAPRAGRLMLVMGAAGRKEVKIHDVIKRSQLDGTGPGQRPPEDALTDPTDPYYNPEADPTRNPRLVVEDRVLVRAKPDAEGNDVEASLPSHVMGLRDPIAALTDPSHPAYMKKYDPKYTGLRVATLARPRLVRLEEDRKSGQITGRRPVNLAAEFPHLRGITVDDLSDEAKLGADYRPDLDPTRNPKYEFSGGGRGEIAPVIREIDAMLAENPRLSRHILIEMRRAQSDAGWADALPDRGTVHGALGEAQTRLAEQRAAEDEHRIGQAWGNPFADHGGARHRAEVTANTKVGPLQGQLTAAQRNARRWEQVVGVLKYVDTGRDPVTGDILPVEQLAQDMSLDVRFDDARQAALLDRIATCARIGQEPAADPAERARLANAEWQNFRDISELRVLVAEIEAEIAPFETPGPPSPLHSRYPGLRHRHEEAAMVYNQALDGIRLGRLMQVDIDMASGRPDFGGRYDIMIVPGDKSLGREGDVYAVHADGSVSTPGGDRMNGRGELLEPLPTAELPKGSSWTGVMKQALPYTLMRRHRQEVAPTAEAIDALNDEFQANIRDWWADRIDPSREVTASVSGQRLAIALSGLAAEHSATLKALVGVDTDDMTAAELGDHKEKVRDARLDLRVATEQRNWVAHLALFFGANHGPNSGRIEPTGAAVGDGPSVGLPEGRWLMMRDRDPVAA